MKNVFSKKRLWRIHSILGLLAGMPLLVIAVTGSLLVFKDEIEGWILPGVVGNSSTQVPGNLDERFATAATSLPSHVLIGWRTYSEVGHSDYMYVIEEGKSDWLKLYLGPRGQPLNEPRRTRTYLMAWILELHYAFFGGHLGLLITGILAVILCLLGFTGILIYRKFWSNFVTLKWGRSARVITGDLHRKAGVIASPVLFIVGLTGAYWNITHAIHDLSEHGIYHEEKAVIRGYYNSSTSLEALLKESRAKISDFHLTYVSLPHEQDLPITLYGSVPSHNPLRSPYGSSVSFDAQSLSTLSVVDIREAGFWQQILDMFMPLHFGNFMGLPGKLLWCLLGFTPALLTLSGSYVFLSRTVKR